MLHRVLQLTRTQGYWSHCTRNRRDMRANEHRVIHQATHRLFL